MQHRFFKFFKMKDLFGLLSGRKLFWFCCIFCRLKGSDTLLLYTYLLLFIALCVLLFVFVLLYVFLKHVLLLQGLKFATRESLFILSAVANEFYISIM